MQSMQEAELVILASLPPMDYPMGWDTRHYSPKHSGANFGKTGSIWMESWSSYQCLGCIKIDSAEEWPGSWCCIVWMV